MFLLNDDCKLDYMDVVSVFLEVLQHCWFRVGMILAVPSVLGFQTLITKLVQRTPQHMFFPPSAGLLPDPRVAQNQLTTLPSILVVYHLNH